jgi:undecaprenyl-diphosphatase
MSAGRPAKDELPEEGINWRLVAIIAAAVAAFLVARKFLPSVDLQKALDDVASTLGSWTYLLVAVLAFGETGAFIGLFVPGEVAVILGGAVAGQGEISLPVILAISWFAAFLGDTTGFTIGHRMGRDFLFRHGHKVGLTKERFGQVEGYFAQHGGKTILIGRFISFVRPLAPFLASSSGMRYRDFAPYSILGTGLWAAAFTLLGYFGARSIDKAAEAAEKGSFVFGAVIVGAIAIWMGVRYLRGAGNRRRIVEWMERRRLLRPLVHLARRFRAPARFAVARVTPGSGVGLELTSLFAVLAVGLFVLVSYTAVVSGSPGPTTGDAAAFDVVDSIRAGWLTSLAKAVTQLGAAYVTVPVALVAAVFLAVRSRWPEFWALVIGTVIVYVAVGDLKSAIDRPRPSDPVVHVHFSGSSFPSGHAAYSTLYIWLAATVAIRIRQGWSRGTALVVAGIVLSLLIGLSRVYLRVHYLSDVNAGWALGASAYSLCAIVALLAVFLRHNGRDARVADDSS